MCIFLKEVGMKKHQKGNGERQQEVKDGRGTKANGSGFTLDNKTDQKLHAVVKEELKWTMCM